jgi:hypothetical protein
VAACSHHRSEALATATDSIATSVLEGTGPASDDLLLLAVEVR